MEFTPRSSQQSILNYTDDRLRISTLAAQIIASGALDVDAHP